MKKLLAISGKRFSGKDNFAAMLVERAARRGVTLQPHAFAAESKRLFVERKAKRGVHISLERLLCERDYKETWRPELTDFTVKSIESDPLVFCRAVADRVEAAEQPGVVTDLRLLLEVRHLRARFGLWVVRLARSDTQRARSGWSYSPSVDGHHTETELDDPALWDEVVHNNVNLSDLGARADDVLRAYLA